MSHFEGTDLLCIRGQRPVFSGLSFALDPGELLLLTGKNGSGKSSLLRLIAGLLPPEGGRFAWDGAEFSASGDAHQQRLHYVGHRDAVKPPLSAHENLRFWSRLSSGAPDDRAVSRALGDFGLAALADIPARMLLTVLKQHLSAGGIAIAATHAEAGFPESKRLDLDGFAAAAKDYWDRMA